MTRPIYVPAIGQYDNIGDIILRRPLLDTLRPHGPMHVYVGNAPEGYVAGLRVRPEDRLYRSFAKWYSSGLRDATRTGITYAFKPGEIQLSLPGLKEHVSVLPLLVLSRLRGGTALRVGVGSRNFSSRFLPYFMPSVRLSDLSLWRDARTRDFVGVGGVIPDLAFREGAAPQPGVATTRNALIVSMRSDRPYPSREWLAGVRAYAYDHGLETWAVTQVFRDDQRSRDLAADLGGSVLSWDGTAHDAQEDRLRALYRRTAVAVSDRLHVLIAAFTEGASPVALLVDDSEKIRRHFDAAGVHDITIDGGVMSRSEVTAAITATVERARETVDAVSTAREKLSYGLGALYGLLGDPGDPRHPASEEGVGVRFG